MRMKTIGYIRIGPDEHTKEWLSLDNQTAKIKAYADATGLELIGIIADVGKSGTDGRREGLQKVMDLVQSRKIDTVIVYRFDRLARETMESLERIGTAFHECEVALHSVTEEVEFQGGYRGSSPIITVIPTQSELPERLARIEELKEVFDSEVMGVEGLFDCPICGKRSRARGQFRGGGGVDYYVPLYSCTNCGYYRIEGEYWTTDY